MSTGLLTLYIAASVDGFIATEDGGVSWLDGLPWQNWIELVVSSRKYL